MTADEKVARHRLSILKLAEALRKASEACRRRGMTRTQFYEYKRRFQTHGLAGLKDLPPVHKTHPRTTPPQTVGRILALSLEHPAWGCCRLSAMLKLEGVSSPTVQNILAKHGMATKFDRLPKLKAKAAQEPIEPTAEQVALIERVHPAYAERHVESAKPGELPSQNLFSVGHLEGSARSTSTRWSIPTAASPSGSSTPASSPRPPPPCCTTTSCTSTRTGDYESRRS